MIVTGSEYVGVAEGIVRVSPLTPPLLLTASNAAECICTDAEARLLGSNPISILYDLRQVTYPFSSSVPSSVT